MLRSILVFSGALAATAAAQPPQYRLQPAATPGAHLDSLVIGRPGQPFLTLLDANGGPRQVFGETLWLGLTPALSVVDAGVLNGVGARDARIPTPSGASLVGLTVFGQAIVLDPTGPNGTFRATNGESAILYQARHVIVQGFEDAVRDGMTGEYDRSVKRRLQGRAPTVRTVRTIPPNQGVPFQQPILNPLNPFGTRCQMVLPARDLGASGQEELVTAIRWRPFGGKVVQDTFSRVVLDLAHSKVVPDFRVGNSGLPRFPNSGLSRTFAQNVIPNDPVLRVFDGPYTFRPGDLRRDGYLAYPAPRAFFTYNGIDSLLLDFKVVPSAGAKGVNGQEIYLMVLSSPRPDGRVLTAGSRTNPVDPFNTQTANTGDNSRYDYQIELTRVRSDARSRWLDSGLAAPDYVQPYFAASTPRGTSLQILYRGAKDANGTSPTLWSSGIDSADGYRYLQYHVVLRGHPSGAVPSLDTLVIGVN